MSREDFDPFSRDFGTRDLDDLREQMARKRDEFFNDRDHGFFSMPRSSFSGLPSATSYNPTPGGAGVPTGGRHSFNLPGSAAGRPAGQWRGGGGGGGGMEDDIFSNQDSIPINVIHERSADPRSSAHPQTNQKHRYGVGPGPTRNTTELPASRPGPGPANGGSSSPRLERAHSEPPAKFQERRKAAVPLYTTIPEGGEQNQHHTLGGGGGGGLGYPPGGSGGPGLAAHPIKTSASAPSVPESQQKQPVPPPRKSPPPQGGVGSRHSSAGPVNRPSSMNLSAKSSTSGQPVQQQGVPTGSQVRHIPIHVEGRQEPLFNTHIEPSPGNTPSASDQQLPFSKPSDYYPPGVQRIRSRDSTSGTSEPDSPMPPPRHPIDEPTTPQGPPPGPIPMGYTPSNMPIPEPTTPQGPPPGPIPMGYLPGAVAQPIQSNKQSVSSESSQPTEGRKLSTNLPEAQEPGSRRVSESPSPRPGTTRSDASSPRPAARPDASSPRPGAKPEAHSPRPAGARTEAPSPRGDLSDSNKLEVQQPQEAKRKTPSPQPESVQQKCEPQQQSQKPQQQQQHDQQQSNQQKQSTSSKPAEFRIPIKVNFGDSSQEGSQPPPQPSTGAKSTPPPASTAAPSPAPPPPPPEDPALAAVNKVAGLVDEIEPRILACKGEGKEKEILEEQLTVLFLKYDALTVPESKPDILKAKKAILAKLKSLEKTLYSVAASSS